MPTNSIEICDNYNQYLSNIYGPFSIRDHIKPKSREIDAIKDLELIANKSLSQLKEENPSLLIFPEDLGALQDGIDDKEKVICSLYPAYDKKYLETGNILGWVGCGDTQLMIYSRFDSNLIDIIEDSEKDQTDSPKRNYKKNISPKNNFFMYYILSKLGAFHLTSLDYSQDEGNSLNNLLTLMFPSFLKNAVSQGLYKEYQTFERNDSNVRGVIDINRHIRRNHPFMGKVAYRTREFSFDNDITQLIRHTIEYIETSPMGAIILGGDAETRQCADVIRQATPTYNEKERGTIINNNLRPKMHPFYTDYISLQKLCMQILHEEGISYGINSDEKVHGILFDGAWLWEAYIYSLLKDAGLGFFKTDNIAKTNAFNLFKTWRDSSDSPFDEESRNAYPDFYNDKCVLDAKYKHLEKRVQREDLYQVISYMHIMPRDIGGYIYPYQAIDSNSTDTKTTDNQPMSIKSFKLEGKGGSIFTIPFKIPHYNHIKEGKVIERDNNWTLFCKKMKEAEDTFKSKLSNAITEASNDKIA